MSKYRPKRAYFGLAHRGKLLSVGTDFAVVCASHQGDAVAAATVSRCYVSSYKEAVLFFLQDQNLQISEQVFVTMHILHSGKTVREIKKLWRYNMKG
jgi:hypothetical protein